MWNGKWMCLRIRWHGGVRSMEMVWVVDGHGIIRLIYESEFRVRKFSLSLDTIVIEK